MCRSSAARRTLAPCATHLLLEPSRVDSYGAINIKLHALIVENDTGDEGALVTKITGFASASALAAVIFGFNLLSLALFGMMTAYQMRVQRDTSSIRLVETKQLPELTLGPVMKWHIFLSHIWSSGQDQVATIKRQLQLLLPGIRVFLDVDDLQEIGKLEEYIEQSQCILIFLSRNYFFSTNCLRELDHALKSNKPLVLVHEEDPGKGGAPLEELKADCASHGAKNGRMAVFERGGEVLTWQRFHDFQLVALEGIASQLLHACDIVLDPKQAPKPPVLYIPGEISRQQLVFDREIVVYVSPANPGAAAMAAELERRYPDTMLEFEFEPSAQLTTAAQQAARRHAMLQGEAQDSNTSMLHVNSNGLLKRLGTGFTHFMLYLNNDTFTGEAGQRLANEVRVLYKARIPFVMVHENDPERGGCPFSRFFQTTPEDLVSDGLYKKIAMAAQSGLLRDVSLALIAKGFGAVPKRGVLANVAHRAAAGAHDLSPLKSTHKLFRSGTRVSTRSSRRESAAGLKKSASLKRLNGGIVGGNVESMVGDDGNLVAATALGVSHAIPGVQPEKKQAASEEASSIEDTYRAEDLLFTISDETLGVEMRTAGALVLIAALKPGSQAEELGVPIGGRITSINGAVAAITKDAVEVQLKNATRPTSLLVLAPDPRASTAPAADTVATESGFSLGMITESISDRLHRMFASDPVEPEPNEVTAKADGTEDPMPEPGMIRNSVLDA